MRSRGETLPLASRPARPPQRGPGAYPRLVAPLRLATRRRHARHEGGGAALLAELLVGIALLAGAAAGGFFFVHRPWPNRLDAAGFAAFPAAPASSRWHDLADLGSLPVFAGGIGLFTLLALLRDRARALACVAGPGLAVVVTERIAKPLVGRHLGVLGGNSYPSGTVTAVAALAAVAVLVAPRLLRPLAALVAIAAVAATSAAVIALRWHFPTDALGGICVGAGTVLVVDGLFHLPRLARARRRRRARPAERVARAHDGGALGDARAS